GQLERSDESEQASKNESGSNERDLDPPRDCPLTCAVDPCRFVDLARESPERGVNDDHVESHAAPDCDVRNRWIKPATREDDHLGKSETLQDPVQRTRGRQI